jgi:putative endonuclease
MAFWVYVLRSARDEKTYTGSTGNLNKRLQEHYEGKVPATRRRRPLRLVYVEEFPTRAAAVRRERYFKTPEGGLEKQRLLRGPLG